MVGSLLSLYIKNRRFGTPFLKIVEGRSVQYRFYWLNIADAFGHSMCSTVLYIYETEAFLIKNLQVVMVHYILMGKLKLTKVKITVRTVQF
jgi:hypothetical protein